MTKENAMKDIKIDKVVLHICAGETGAKLDNAKTVLGLLTNGRKPAPTKSKTKLPKWGLRPGLVIGTKITLRGKESQSFILKALKAKGSALSRRSFDKSGNFAFGIKEYIDVEGMKYDPKMGIFGFDVMVNLKRNGYRVKARNIRPTKVGSNGLISRDEAQEFVRDKYKVKVE